MRWFGSKKGATAAPAQETAQVDAAQTEGELRAKLNQKEIELYPIAIKLLWHYYDPQDSGKEFGSSKEFPGPVDDTVNDSVGELEKVGLLEVIPTFSDFSITAKLTRLGLQVMAGQSQPGHLDPVSIENPGSGALTIYKEVDLS